MLKGIIRKVGQELNDWKRAVKVISDEVEGGKGLHQFETDRRNRLREAENVSSRRETSGRGKETESN